MSSTGMSLRASLLLEIPLLVCLFGQVSPVEAQRHIGHSACCGRQDVILIRGGAGYWPGADDMADHFESLGYRPTIVQHWQHRAVARQIIQATREGRMAGGVVIVGYSSGADSACTLARHLGDAGIRVPTMVLMESTFGRSVPANVDYCVNYYASRPLDRIPMFRGVPVEADSPYTVLYNINVKDYPQYAELARKNHFTISSTPMMQQLAGSIVASRQAALISPSPSVMMGTAPASSTLR